MECRRPPIIGVLAGSTRKHSFFRPIRALLLLWAVVSGLWIERSALLRGMAKAWVVSDSITSSDVAVVLGGGLDTRPFAAAELYKEQLVRKVLISASITKRVPKGIAPTDVQSTILVLKKLGLP